MSEESAQGFRSVLASLAHERSSRLIVLSGASAVTTDVAVNLRRQIEAGTWVIWESSPVYSQKAPFQIQQRVLQESFGITVAEPVGAPAAYTRYCWPHPALTRTFLSVIPVKCTADEVVGYHNGIPIAMKRSIGRAGIVFLGSMLGPHLRAGDREATQFAAELLRVLPVSRRHTRQDV